MIETYSLSFLSLSLPRTNTPALCIAFDTKAREMEHINKVQSAPLLFLIQRGEKKLFIFIYLFFEGFFCFFFRTPHLFLWGGFLKAKQHGVTTIQRTTNNWQAEPAPLLCSGHTTSVLQAENRWLGEDLANTKTGDFLCSFFFFFQERYTQRLDYFNTGRSWGG